MKRKVELYVMLCALLLAWVGLVSTPLQAQVLYGAIAGNVVDPSGATIPGAEVTILNKLTNYSQMAVTNDTGSYSVLNVPTGTYTLKVSLQGFKEHVADDLVVTPANVTRANVTLQVGEITEAVTVTAGATLLQTDTTDVRAQLEAKEITDLPLAKYRNYQSLINLVPGATPARFQNAVIDTPNMALSTNINGTNRNNNNTRIDGAISVNIWLPHHTGYVPPAETIEVVNISTNNFDAEMGFAGGAAVTVLTKSGTNAFHGSLFALHQNAAQGAREFFADEKPKSIHNIDGFTIGGPIRKDKLFFFFGYEANINRQGFTFTETVATADQRAGDFSAYNTIIYDPLTGTADGRNRTPFANNKIPQDRMSTAALKMQALVPLPTLPGTAANFQRSAAQRYNKHNVDTKVDWYRSDNHRIWGKFSVMDALVSAEPVFGAGGGRGLSQLGSGTGDTVVKVYGLGHNWTLSPTFLVDGNFGFTDMAQSVTQPDVDLGSFGQDVLGIPGTNKTDERSCPAQRCDGMPGFSIAGYSSFGGLYNWLPIYRDERSLTFTQNFSWTKKNHDLRFGYDVVKHLLDHWQPEVGEGPRGRFNFNREMTGLRGGPRVTDQNAYAAFLLGLPNSFGKSLQWELLTGREWQHAWYIRDRWQVTPKLTLTLGLRYEYYPLISRKDRGIEKLDFSTLQVSLGGVAGIPRNLGIKTSKTLFAPRLGFAYRITENDVIRSGYGITYSPIPFSRPVRGFYPLTIAAGFVGAHAWDPFRTLAQGIPLFTGPDLSAGILDLPAPVTMQGLPLDRVNRGYIQSWNLIYERKLPGQLVLSTGYVGTHTVHGMTRHNLNWAAVGTGRAGQKYFSFGGRTAPTYWLDGWIDGNYHSLQVALNRRFTGGLFLKGAYTFSKAINMTDEEAASTLLWNDTSILRRNRARAIYDLPQIFQLGSIYELPLGRGGEGVKNYLLRGWQLNAIVSGHSRPPFTVGASGASLNAPGNGQTADQVKSTVQKLGGIGRNNPYYDRSAFARVTEVRYGTSGRNILLGPNWWNLDLSIFRQFALKEAMNLEFRLESFNFTNTPKFLGPTSSVDSSAFMWITSTSPDSNARLIRFGLRLTF